MSEEEPSKSEKGLLKEDLVHAREGLAKELGACLPKAILALAVPAIIASCALFWSWWVKTHEDREKTAQLPLNPPYQAPNPSRDVKEPILEPDLSDNRKEIGPDGDAGDKSNGGRKAKTEDSDTTEKGAPNNDADIPRDSSVPNEPPPPSIVPQQFLSLEYQNKAGEAIKEDALLEGLLAALNDGVAKTELSRANNNYPRLKIIADPQTVPRYADGLTPNYFPELALSIYYYNSAGVATPMKDIVCKGVMSKSKPTGKDWQKLNIEASSRTREFIRSIK